MDRLKEEEQERYDYLASVLDSIPPVEAAFAYGSGVFEQPNLYDAANGNKPMLDFVFAVASPRHWHSENLIENGHHYSGMAAMGPAVVDAISNHVGIGIHFNTLVPWKQRLIKYGVVSLETLNHDLNSWQHLYLSGRLQKPVLWLKKNASLQENLCKNLKSALTAALLLLPQQFSEEDLLHAICKLSYSGDIRMNLAEDKQKIKRIVQGSRPGLINLYDPFLKTHLNDRNSLIHEKDSKFRWSHEMELSQKTSLVKMLPKDVIRDIQSNRGLHEVIETGLYKQNLAAALRQRVSRASRNQAVAGLFAVGAYKSSRYIFEKIKKVWKS